MPKKKKPFAEHDLRVTLHCAGKKIKPFAEYDLRVTLECAGNKKLYELKPARDAHSCHIYVSSLTLIFRSLAGYSCNAQ